MKFISIPACSRTAVAALALLLSACNDQDALRTGDDHGHGEIETSGRLVYGKADGINSRVYVYDLHDEAVAGEFPLAHAPSAIYASPEKRYAVVLQRNDDKTSFIDGGVWQEDHGDHLHDYVENPLKLALEITGPRPTHYESHEELAALFLDGRSPDEAAGVRVLSDESLGAGVLEAGLALPRFMHGTAEPRGDYLLTTFRADGASGTLPSAVELYQRSGDGYVRVDSFGQAACVNLHGSYSNHDHTAFGCSGGVLVVTQDGTAFSTRFITNPASMITGTNIGTVAGHHDLAAFAGFAGSDLFVIDPDAGSMTKVDWMAGSGVTKAAHAMDAHAERFLILDSIGRLHVLDPAQGWQTRASAQVLTSVSGTTTMVVSHAEDVAFITDNDRQSIVVVELESLSTRQIPLGFVPAGLAWVGVGAGHAHD